MLTNIFRVENSKGQGCYYLFNANDKFQFLKKHNGSTRHPCSCRDFGIDRDSREGEIFGFESLQQAHKWFTLLELRKLKKLGFELKVVPVLAITETGRCQVLAIRKQS